MSGTLWIPGAERITPSSPGGIITSTAPPRAVWHTTEADPGTQEVWDAMIRVLRSKGAEPQVLYDPVTDRLGQFFALDLSGRALKNDGATRTNRVGKVCIQIEVIARSAKPFTNYWKPGPNFRALMAALRSHGIVESWPAGPPPKFTQVGTGGYNTPENARYRTIWLTKGGHYSHSEIPGNDHGDPGGIDTVELFAAGEDTTEGEISMADAASIERAIADLKKDIYAGPRYSALQNSINAGNRAIAAIIPYLKSEDAADDAALQKAVADLHAAIDAAEPTT